VTTLEFWPDYGSGPLWEDGKAIDPLSIGLPHELADEIAAWNREYVEDKLPLEGRGDVAWLNEGVTLLHRMRAALGVGIPVVVTEPWWGEDPI
jgi:hypothetical protein